MDGNMVALLVAAVGMLGTLTSPVIGQRLAARSRQEEREAQRLDALEAREQARTEAVLAERKAAYVAFNAAARRYRVQLMTYLHAVHEHNLDQGFRTDLAEARAGYFSALAEVQIVAPDEVLACVEELGATLASAFDSIKTLERGSSKPGGSFPATQQKLLGTRASWQELRRVMRIDLGLEPAEPHRPGVRPDAARSPSA